MSKLYDMDELVEISEIDVPETIPDPDTQSQTDDNTADDIPRALPVILAVDDMPELLSTINSMLEGKYKVISVTSGKAALGAIKKHTPELFILDIEMPGMNGYELAGIIRKDKKFETTPILFLTSQNTQYHVMAALQYGGNDYILKPVNKQMLLNKIARHLAMGGKR